MKKIELLKDNAVDNDITECTFKPKLFTKEAAKVSQKYEGRERSFDSSHETSVLNFTSVDKYVNRMN